MIIIWGNMDKNNMGEKVKKYIENKSQNKNKEKFKG